MMRLDVRGAVAATGFDDVRVKRALHEELDLLALGTGLLYHLALRLLESADEFFADDLALRLRIGDALECIEEILGGIDGDELDAGRRDEIMFDLLGLALA